MQVVKSGDGRKGWAKQLTCEGLSEKSGCGAILLVEEADVRCFKDCDYLGGCDIVCTFQCPECTQETYITKHVPHHVQNKLCI